MLPIAIISLLLPTPQTQPSSGRLPVHPAVGHLGLTVIALIYILLSVWQS
jgi:hypothetical protein